MVPHPVVSEEGVRREATGNEVNSRINVNTQREPLVG